MPGDIFGSHNWGGGATDTQWTGTGMLLNIRRRTGHPPQQRIYSVRNVDSAESSGRCHGSGSWQWALWGGALVPCHSPSLPLHCKCDGWSSSSHFVTCRREIPCPRYKKRESLTTSWSYHSCFLERWLPDCLYMKAISNLFKPREPSLWLSAKCNC